MCPPFFWHEGPPMNTRCNSLKIDVQEENRNSKKFLVIKKDSWILSYGPVRSILLILHHQNSRPHYTEYMHQ